jgi:hypothetical protein
MQWQISGATLLPLRRNEMNFQYMDDRLGFVETVSDTAWAMDDFGMLVRVPFSLPDFWFWRE